MFIERIIKLLHSNKNPVAVMKKECARRFIFLTARLEVRIPAEGKN